MNKHTAEPWLTNTNSQGDWDISPDGEDMICDLKGCANSEANAVRIVACVNACAGLNPDAVPGLVSALRAALNHIEHGWTDPALCIAVADIARAALAKAEGGA